MDQERFRLLLWSRCLPLLALPVFGFMVYVSPFAAGWSLGVWVGIGTVVAVLVGAYLADAWRKSAVTLDESGIKVFTTSWQAYEWRQLVKVRQIGVYRVRMCLDVGMGEKHWHVTLDVVRSDAFVDALLDWYAEVMGQELAAAGDQQHAA